MTKPMALPSLTGRSFSQVSKVDLILCLCAIVLGGAIVLVNHQVPGQSNYDNLSQPFTQLINRMNLISDEFNDWYIQDTGDRH